MSATRAHRGARTRHLRRPAAVVLAVGLVALGALALAILQRSAPRRSGTNGTPAAGAVVLAPGQQLCEPGELLPGDTAALRLHGSLGAAPASDGGPAIAASVAGPHGPVGSGVLAAGWRPGALRIPIGHVSRTIAGASVCLRNDGTRPASFAGSVPYGAALVMIDGKPLGGRLRIEYMRPGSESWLALLPTLAHRFSLAKADLLRHWEAFAVLVLMALAIGVAARTVLNAERET